MVKLVFSPDWFYGKDMVIDLFSILIPFMIGYFALRCYRLSKRKEHLFISSSFFLIALSFIFKILTNFTIYYNVTFTRTIGLVTVTFHTMRSDDIIADIGFFVFRILMLAGLYFLFVISERKKSTITHHFLFLFLLTIVAFYSHYFYHAFHITALIFSILIAINFFTIYRKNRSLTTQLMAISFIIIALSNLVFALGDLHNINYVIGEVIQLAGYLLLLIAFIKVLHGQKKDKS